MEGIEAMPFESAKNDCGSCPSDERCIEDRRKNPVKGRKTKLRVLQANATHCTFADLVPGYDGAARSYVEYIEQWEQNAKDAADRLFGAANLISHSQLAKTSGDVLELVLAAGLWNLAADWNQFMETGIWKSPLPKPDAVACPDRKVAIVTLPRGYSAMGLFTPEARRKIDAFNHALGKHGMELRLSSPDIVGIRLPEYLEPELDPFMSRLSDMGPTNRPLLEQAYRRLEDRVEGHGFLFAIAVKKSVRSDRLYQPLFEANVLKYLIQEVLRGAALRFHVWVMSDEGAAVNEHYRAASLFSLLRGGSPERAVDNLHVLSDPAAALGSVLDELPRFIV